MHPRIIPTGRFLWLFAQLKSPTKTLPHERQYENNKPMTTSSTVCDRANNSLAKDLSREFPRSPRESLGGYLIAARTLDKCRADLAGTVGDYRFNCSIDQRFFGFAGIDADEFRSFVATGATDKEVAAWIEAHAMPRPRSVIWDWNREQDLTELTELSDDAQASMAEYIAKNLPQGKYPHTLFDVMDMEEGRL